MFYCVTYIIMLFKYKKTLYISSQRSSHPGLGLTKAYYSLIYNLFLIPTTIASGHRWPDQTQVNVNVTCESYVIGKFMQPPVPHPVAACVIQFQKFTFNFWTPKKAQENRLDCQDLICTYHEHFPKRARWLRHGSNTFLKACNVLLGH